METPRDRTDQPPPKQTTLVYICGGRHGFAIAVSCCSRQLMRHSAIVILALSVLTAIFQVDLGYPVPECLHSGFHWSYGDGGGGNSWSYKTCKAPVKMSPSTNQHPVFFTGRMPFLSSNQRVDALKGNVILRLIY